MISPSSSYYSPAPGLGPSPQQSYSPYPQSNSPAQPMDAESKLKRGWNEGIKENMENKSMTAAMGIGCLAMNLIPGLRMKWGTALKMSIANMGLMALINQGFGMKKGFQGKTN